MRKLLWAFRTDTRIKAQIDDDLLRLLNGELTLLRYGVSDAQIVR